VSWQKTDLTEKETNTSRQQLWNRKGRKSLSYSKQTDGNNTALKPGGKKKCPALTLMNRQRGVRRPRSKGEGKGP